MSTSKRGERRDMARSGGAIPVFSDATCTTRPIARLSGLCPSLCRLTFDQCNEPCSCLAPLLGCKTGVAGCSAACRRSTDQDATLTSSVVTAFASSARYA